MRSLNHVDISREIDLPDLLDWLACVEHRSWADVGDGFADCAAWVAELGGHAVACGPPKATEREQH